MRKKLFIFLVAVMSMIPMTAMAAPKTMSDGGRFDAKYYAATYPEIAQAIGTDENQLYLHYQVFGKPAGLMPFDIMAAVNTPGSVEAKKFIAPKEATVIAALQKIPGVGAIEGVTMGHDPNNKLMKPGGYISSTYFEITNAGIDQSSYIEIYKSTNIVDRGTSSGGNIEVYPDVASASKRDAYHAAFDGSVIASGHVLIGTTIIRTSRDMNAAQQQHYTFEFIKNMVTQ